MSKSVFTDAYASAITQLVALRKERGVSQTELAHRLGKTQQWVSYVETNERRLDIIEFYAIARALGVEPVALYEAVTRELPAKVAI